MHKEHLRSTLAGVSLAGLIAGVTVLPMGCAGPVQGSCGKGPGGSGPDTGEAPGTWGTGRTLTPWTDRGPGDGAPEPSGS